MVLKKISSICCAPIYVGALTEWSLHLEKIPGNGLTKVAPRGQLWELLWNIFQNDLVYEIERNLSMYADDNQLFEISDNVATINDNLNANARKASSWYESNLLKGNLSKYHTMLIQ